LHLQKQVGLGKDWSRTCAR